MIISPNCILVIALLFTSSCRQTNCDWKGGEITTFGSFCTGELVIKVFEKDNYLKYEVRNKSDGLVINQDMNISVFQNWGLFLDSKKNLWVFSSDVGTGIWESNAVGTYNKRMFHHELTVNEVPHELVQSSLKRYLRLE